MSARRPQPVARFVAGHHLLQQATRLAHWTRAARACLPGAGLHVVGVDLDDLVLVTDSGPWATRLRYEQKPFLECFRRHTGLAVQRLRVRVRPGPTPAPATVSTAGTLPPLSADNARLLLATADGLADDRLATALKRLARHGQSEDQRPAAQ